MTTARHAASAETPGKPGLRGLRERVTGRNSAAGIGRGPGYRPALDGVRAIAVGSVLLYHGGVAWARGGFLGVDVFFVLSGYLITSLLLHEWAKWRAIDLVGFYVRRARRLLPALVLVVAAVGIWAAWFAKSDKLSTIRGDGIASLLYVTNWRFILVKASYFDQFGDPSPFRHTWSLAIEEQYYLLFPLLLIGLLRLSRRRRWVLPSGLGLIAAASAIEMAALYDPVTDPSRVYYGTDTRIHELMIGSLLGVLFTRRRHKPGHGDYDSLIGKLVGPAALIGVLAALATLTDHAAFLYRGGFALVCVVTALLVLAIEVAPRSLVGRLLSVRPMAWIGMVSYGLYLWHWPIFIALSPDRTGLHDTPLLLLRLAVTLGVATLSYYAVERPIRSGALGRLPRLAGRSVAALGIPAGLTALLIGTAGGVAAQLPDSPFGTSLGTGGHTVMVVGDSVGFSLGSAFPASSFPNYKVVDHSELGCGLGEQWLAFDGEQGNDNREQCADQFQRWRDETTKVQPESVLLVFGAWDVFDHVVDGKILKESSRAYRDYLTARLDQAHQVLTSTGARLLIPNVPCYREQKSAVIAADSTKFRNDPARAEVLNRVIDDFAATHSDVTVVDLAGYLCSDPAQSQSASEAIRYDGVHFTKPGAAAAWHDVLIPALQGGKPGQLVVMTLGDSVPYGLVQRFPKADYPGVKAVANTQLGCSLVPDVSVADGSPIPLQDNCKSWSDSVPAAIDRVHPTVGMVWVGIGEQFDKQLSGGTVAFGSPEHTAWLTAALKARIELFRSRDIPVLVPTVPCHREEDSGLSGAAEIVNDESRIQANNDLIRRVVAGYASGVQVVELHDALCADGYTNQLDGVELRYDGVHFTNAGSAAVWEILMPAIRAAAKQP